MAMQGDDDTWSPPSESDMKMLRARREHQDRISRLMGDYLLKGYRMLGESCEACGTILLQDRQKKLHCVSCQELDSDTEKDNPVLNHQAALSQVREQQLSHQPCQGNPQTMDLQPASTPKLATDPLLKNPDPIPTVPNQVISAETALLNKISWASHQLQETTSIEYSSQLCALISTCAQSLHSLRGLRL
ncbi:protein ZNRD2 [Rhinophrynus dorsalis]